MGMKYVVYDDDSYSIFPVMITHSEMRIMGKLPVSAGFLSITKSDGERTKVRCYGESLSLDLVSRYEEDEQIIELGFKMSGMV